MNEEGIPFKSVFESSFVTPNVTRTPSTITAVKSSAERKEEAVLPAAPIKNMVMIAISVGNLPLHGTKLFVKIARSRSRGESIIRHPTIPAALHPNPMHIDVTILY